MKSELPLTVFAVSVGFGMMLYYVTMKFYLEHVSDVFIIMGTLMMFIGLIISCSGEKSTKLPKAKPCWACYKDTQFRNDRKQPECIVCYKGLQKYEKRTLTTNV